MIRRKGGTKRALKLIVDKTQEKRNEGKNACYWVLHASALCFYSSSGKGEYLSFKTLTKLSFSYKTTLLFSHMSDEQSRHADLRGFQVQHIAVLMNTNRPICWSGKY